LECFEGSKLAPLFQEEIDMSDLQKWVKPNGKAVEINAESESAARALGWLPAAEYAAAQKEAKKAGKDD
jgi:hypothetical protein